MPKYRNIDVSPECHRALTQLGKESSNPHPKTADETANEILKKALENPKKLRKTIRKLIQHKDQENYPYLAILAEKKRFIDPIAHLKRVCRDCARYRTTQCKRMSKDQRYLIEPDQQACDVFLQKRGGRLGSAGRGKRRKKEQEWKLDIFAKVPETMKPCGFYGDKLTEASWLPYRDKESNKLELRPSLLIVTKGKGYKIVDFQQGSHNIKGTFPSQELRSLMQPQSVQMLDSKATIEPKKVDKEIDDILRKHLDMPDAERILAKRWIEGTFFYDCFDAFPIQCVLGVSESGKSRLNLVNLALGYHSEIVIDPTGAGIFRSKEEDKVTLCVDEAEYLRDPNLYATLKILLNASYSKYSGYVSRYDEQDDGKRIKKRFDLYSPLTICGIAGLEGVTLSRAFRIVMRRVDKDFIKCNPRDYETVRSMLYVLRIRHVFEVREIYEKMDISKIVTARFEELFKPLFTMTEFMGTQEEHDILARWCKEYQTNFRIEALNVGQEEQILQSLSEIPNAIGHPDWYKLKHLADWVHEQYGRRVSSKYVSNILYRLGMQQRKKVRGVTLAYAPRELMNECASRIGVHISELLPLPSLPPPPKEDWLKEAK